MSKNNKLIIEELTKHIDKIEANNRSMLNDLIERLEEVEIKLDGLERVRRYWDER